MSITKSLNIKFMTAQSRVQRFFFFVLTVLLALTNLSVNPIEISKAEASPSCIGEGLDLGTAGNFSVLAPVITLAGSTTMNSAIGAHSFAEATGQAEVTDPAVQKHFGNETYTVAIADLGVAIDCALSWSASAIPFNDPSHLTFTPGVYIQTAVEATTAATSVITLDAQSNPDGVFVFLFPGNFTPGATVNMLGGAKPENVFWVMAGDFTLGAASSIWVGNVLSGRNITLGGSDTILGRVLAKTAVTTSANIITSPAYTRKVIQAPWITFSKSTLEPITAGVPYSDSITAQAMVNGIASLAVITYSVETTTPLPSGLNFNATTGVLSGTLAESTLAGDVNLNFTAFASSISSPPVRAVLKVKAKPSKSIVFTDTTLVDATIGTFYSDTATAVAKIDTATSSATITYAVDTSTPLPAGLTLNSQNGVVSGTLPAESRVETRTVTIIASSDGFPSQSLSYTFAVKAKPTPDPLPPTLDPPPPTLDPPPPTLDPPAQPGGGSSPAYIPPSEPSASPLVNATSSDTVTVVINETTTAISALADTIDPLDIPPKDSSEVEISAELETLLIEPTAEEIAAPVATLMMTALFANNSSKLDSKTQKAIKAMTVKLKKMKIAAITVAGFSSSAGGVDNLKLSVARAKTLAALLLVNGVKAKITIKGLGIIESSKTKSAMALTRKAELWVVLKEVSATNIEE